MTKTCEKCGADMNYSEGPGHLWKGSCTKCEFKESGTFSPLIEPYTGKYYSIYLKPTSKISNDQAKFIKRMTNDSDNLAQIKNKYSNCLERQIIPLLHDSTVEPVTKQFISAGLQVKVVERDES